MTDIMSRLTDVEDAHQGPVACLAVISTILRLRGLYTVEVSIGCSTKRPGEVLVLVVVAGVKAIFTPLQLRTFGETLIESLPMARKLGATQVDEDQLRAFAEMLIRNAEDAVARSPYGLH